MRGIIFKKTEKVNMGWSKLVRLGIVFLWKLCEVEGMNRFTRRIRKPMTQEFFNSKEGAEYIGSQNTMHFFKEEKPPDTEYNEDSEQTKWRKENRLQGILQLIIEELKETYGIKV